MATNMPLKSPELTDENIGRTKGDAEPIVNLFYQVPAREYNQLRQELIACCDLARSLANAGATGTLQNTYNNGTSSPTEIVIDSMRGPVSVKDASPSLSGYLIQTRATGGGILSGLGTIKSQVLAQPAGAGAAYGIVIDEDPYVKIDASIVPGGGDLTGNLGVPGKRFGNLNAGAISGYNKITTFNANLSFNCAAATAFDVTLTGNVNSIAFSNVSEGQLIYLIFRQDGTGNREYTGAAMPSNIRLRNGVGHFQFSPGPGQIDVFVFVGLSQNGVLGGQVAEVARYQPNPIETRPLTFDLNVTGDLTLYPHRDLSNQVRLVAGGGTLNANTTVDLIGSGFARSGDELKLYFNNFACGLRTLLIKGDGTTFLTYNPTENLNGYVQIVYWDGVWNGYEGALGIT